MKPWSLLFRPTGTVPVRQELFTIQSLRGIAAAIVVLNHLQFYQVKYFGKAAWLPSSMCVGEFGVDLFFVISGFIMTYVTPRAFPDWRDQAAFLLRRFLRVYPVYWALAIPLIFIWLYDPKLINSHEGNEVNITTSLLLIPSRIPPVLGVAWTLIYEIYFYCIASLIFYFAGRWRILLISIWLLAIVASRVIHPGLFSFACLNVWLSTLSFEFMAGMLLAHFIQNVSIRISGLVASLLILLALAAAFYNAVRHGRYVSDPFSNTRCFFYGLPALVTVGTVVQMEIQGQWSLVKSLVWLGDRSYSLYLVHLPILSGFLLLASRFIHHSGRLEASLLILVVVVLLPIPMELCYRFVEKPSHLVARHMASLASHPGRLHSKEAPLQNAVVSHPKV